jgi:hypothetical protein
LAVRLVLCGTSLFGVKRSKTHNKVIEI